MGKWHTCSSKFLKPTTAKSNAILEIVEREVYTVYTIQGNREDAFVWKWLYLQTRREIVHVSSWNGNRLTLNQIKLNHFNKYYFYFIRAYFIAGIVEQAVLGNKGISTQGTGRSGTGQMHPLTCYMKQGVCDNREDARSLKIVFCLPVRIQVGNNVQCIIRSLKVLLDVLYG